MHFSSSDGSAPASPVHWSFDEAAWRRVMKNVAESWGGRNFWNSFLELNGKSRTAWWCWLCPSWKMMEFMEFVNGFRMTSLFYEMENNPFMSETTNQMGYAVMYTTNNIKRHSVTMAFWGRWDQQPLETWNGFLTSTRQTSWFHTFRHLFRCYGVIC